MGGGKKKGGVTDLAQSIFQKAGKKEKDCRSKEEKKKWRGENPMLFHSSPIRFAPLQKRTVIKKKGKRDMEREASVKSSKEEREKKGKGDRGFPCSRTPGGKKLTKREKRKKRWEKPFFNNIGCEKKEREKVRDAGSALLDLL